MKMPLFKIIALPILAITSIFFIFKLIGQSNIFPQKRAGSFEYVRTGEDFLKKGDYRAAVACFERANNASPGNKVIASSLVYAYSKWAEYMAEEEKYDKAIEYFNKAYEVAQDNSAKQNLAVMYSKEALYEERKGYHIYAARDYTNARAVATDSDIVRKNLSVSLFNDAVNEYKAGNEDLAIRCLKEAALSYEDAKVFEFLGDIYYKKTELDKASFYWNKAKELIPGNKKAAEKLEKLAREIALAKTAEIKEYSHFEVRVGEGLSIDSDTASQVLEEAYVDVGKDLGYFPKNKTVVFFYSEGSFRDIFELPRTVMSFYDGNIRMPFPGKAMDKDMYKRYIYHEYTHAVVSAKTNNNSPVWLNEGIAVWEELKAANQNTVNHLAKIGDISSLSVSSLDASFRNSKDKTDLSASYLSAYTVVKYIVDTWGMSGLRDILARIANGQHFMNAVDDEFLLSEKEFENRWKEHLKKGYGVSS